MSAESGKGIESLPSNAYLIINSRVFPLDQEAISIGRSLENHLVINDPSVSRKHALLVAVEGHFEVHDLNSTNGTTVNGHAVGEHPLSSGDTVAFADVPTVYIEYSKEMLDKARDRTSYPISGDG